MADAARTFRETTANEYKRPVNVYRARIFQPRYETVKRAPVVFETFRFGSTTGRSFSWWGWSIDRGRQFFAPPPADNRKSFRRFLSNTRAHVS